MTPCIFIPSKSRLSYDSCVVAAAVLEDQEGFRELARVCVGYVAADLAALVREAAMEASPPHEL